MTDVCSFRLSYCLVVCVRNKCDVSCTLNSNSKLSLMLCASTCDSSGKDLCALREHSAILCDILIIDMFDLIYTKAASFLLHLLAFECRLFGTFSIHCSLTSYNKN